MVGDIWGVKLFYGGWGMDSSAPMDDKRDELKREREYVCVCVCVNEATGR